MDEVSYSFENEQQFWLELDDLLSAPCETHESIDNTLRSYLNLTTSVKDEYINTEYDVANCNYRLLSSDLFAKHGDYIRQQIIYGLLQDDAPDVLLFIASFLQFDGRQNEKGFEMMNNEGAFPKLMDLIMGVKDAEEAGLHRLLMELLYEMSRIQRIKLQDLVLVEDDFVRHLFEIIEELSDDVNDPYHYPVIRVLLVLNEQFMVSAHDPNLSNPPSAPLTNRVMKILSSEGGKYKTFGENIILLLNRESETSLQLLTLKLMYLLFTTPSTQEYFYTNDLHVLVDILIRNLLDLPEDAVALRHTYLRVLYPLLSHTQLRHPPHYKRDEIRNLLAVLVRGQQADLNDEPSSSATTDHADPRMRYFEDVDETTIRLVGRCGRVSWLKDPELLRTLAAPRLDTEKAPDAIENQEASPTSATTTNSSTFNTPPTPPLPRKLHKRNSSKTSTGSISLNAAAAQLGMDLDSARTSSLSVLEVAAQREKPGVITPSRKSSGVLSPILAKKEKPAPPKARRSGWMGRKKASALEGEDGVGDGHAAATAEIGSSVSPSQPPVPPEDPVQDFLPQEEEVPSMDGTEEPKPSASNPPQSAPKKPPPAPKSRRWRLNRKGPDPAAAVPAISFSEPHSHPDSQPQPQSPPSLSVEADDLIPTIAPSLAESEPRTPSDSPRQKESISSALQHAQAEAVEEITERMEGVNLQSLRSPRKPPEVGGLAPPNMPPRRGVVGPRFEVLGTAANGSEGERERERSPFSDELGNGSDGRGGSVSASPSASEGEWD
ncbi:MAG: hypothetical protein Q9160_000811 [Pyrenula sp. 1 TL-2023]